MHLRFITDDIVCFLLVWFFRFCVQDFESRIGVTVEGNHASHLSAELEFRKKIKSDLHNFKSEIDQWCKKETQRLMEIERRIKQEEQQTQKIHDQQRELEQCKQDIHELKRSISYGSGSVSSRSFPSSSSFSAEFDVLRSDVTDLLKKSNSSHTAFADIQLDIATLHQQLQAQALRLQKLQDQQSITGATQQVNTGISQTEIEKKLQSKFATEFKNVETLRSELRELRRSINSNQLSSSSLSTLSASEEILDKLQRQQQEREQRQQELQTAKFHELANAVQEQLRNFEQKMQNQVQSKLNVELKNLDNVRAEVSELRSSYEYFQSSPSSSPFSPRLLLPLQNSFDSLKNQFREFEVKNSGIEEMKAVILRLMTRVETLEQQQEQSKRTEQQHKEEQQQARQFKRQQEEKWQEWESRCNHRFTAIDSTLNSLSSISSSSSNSSRISSSSFNSLVDRFSLLENDFNSTRQLCSSLKDSQQIIEEQITEFETNLQRMQKKIQTNEQTNRNTEQQQLEVQEKQTTMTLTIQKIQQNLSNQEATQRQIENQIQELRKHQGATGIEKVKL